MDVNGAPTDTFAGNYRGTSTYTVDVRCECMPEIRQRTRSIPTVTSNDTRPPTDILATIVLLVIRQRVLSLVGMTVDPGIGPILEYGIS